MLRINFSATVALISGVLLTAAIVGCSDSASNPPPAANDSAAGNTAASSPAQPAKRPALPPPPPETAFESTPGKTTPTNTTSANTTGAGQSSTSSSAESQPAAKPSENRKYPPEMLPDAKIDIPAWAGKDKDEPFDVKQFLESRAAPEDNGATLYFLALADISENMDFVYPPDQWAKRLPQVKALEKDIGDLCDPEKLKAGSIPLSEIERVLKNAQPTLDKVDQAQQKKCIFVSGMGFDSMAPHVQDARQICRADCLHIYHAQMKDDFTEAEQSIKRSLQFASDLRPRGLMVNQLVSFAIENIILEDIADYTLKQQSLKPEQCDRLLVLLADRQRLLKPALTEGLKMEYIICRNTINEFQNGRLNGDALETIFKFINMDGKINITEDHVANINWQTDITELNRVCTYCLLIIAKPYDKSAFIEFENTEIPKLKGERAIVTLLLVPTIPIPCEAYNRTQAHLAGTQCLIAVRKYILSHNKIPADLATAVSETELKTVPLDPFDGKPMRYKVVDEKPIVYSIGPDQKDDGATLDWIDAMPSGDLIYRIGE
jgi:hypothetical protein